MTPADAELSPSASAAGLGARRTSCLRLLDQCRNEHAGYRQTSACLATCAPSRCSDREFVRRLTETIEARSASQPYLADWKSAALARHRLRSLREEALYCSESGERKKRPRKFRAAARSGDGSAFRSRRMPSRPNSCPTSSRLRFLRGTAKPRRLAAAGASWKLGKHDFAGDEDSAAIAPVENLIRYVSEFAVADNTIMWIGPIGHGPDDLSIPADQAFIPFLTAWSVRPVGPARRIEGFDRVVGSSGRSKFAH